jgi:hypothetical protein
VQNISDDSGLLAVIIRPDFQADGIVFATPNELPQQLGYMNRPAGYEIASHVHVLKRYEVEFSSKNLFIRKSKVRIDFYSEEKQYLSSEILMKAFSGFVPVWQCNEFGIVK